MEGEEYSMDCFKFLYSKVIECAFLMAKLEWCVSDICREKDNATSQVDKVVRKDPFDDFDDFSSDSIGTTSNIYYTKNINKRQIKTNV